MNVSTQGDDEVEVTITALKQLPANVELVANYGVETLEERKDKTKKVLDTIKHEFEQVGEQVLAQHTHIGCGWVFVCVCMFVCLCVWCKHWCQYSTLVQSNSQKTTHQYMYHTTQPSTQDLIADLRTRRHNAICSLCQGVPRMDDFELQEVDAING